MQIPALNLPNLINRSIIQPLSNPVTQAKITMIAFKSLQALSITFLNLLTLINHSVIQPLSNNVTKERIAFIALKTLQILGITFLAVTFPFGGVSVTVGAVAAGVGLTLLNTSIVLQVLANRYPSLKRNLAFKIFQDASNIVAGGAFAFAARPLVLCFGAPLAITALAIPFIFAMGRYMLNNFPQGRVQPQPAPQVPPQPVPQQPAQPQPVQPQPVQPQPVPPQPAQPQQPSAPQAEIRRGYPNAFRVDRPLAPNQFLEVLKHRHFQAFSPTVINRMCKLNIPRLNDEQLGKVLDILPPDEIPLGLIIAFATQEQFTSFVVPLCTKIASDFDFNKMLQSLSKLKSKVEQLEKDNANGKNIVTEKLEAMKDMASLTQEIMLAIKQERYFRNLGSLLITDSLRRDVVVPVYHLFDNHKTELKSLSEELTTQLNTVKEGSLRRRLEVLQAAASVAQQEQPEDSDEIPAYEALGALSVFTEQLCREYVGKLDPKFIQKLGLADFKGSKMMLMNAILEKKDLDTKTKLIQAGIIPADDGDAHPPTIKKKLLEALLRD